MCCSGCTTQYTIYIYIFVSVVFSCFLLPLPLFGSFVVRSPLALLSECVGICMAHGCFCLGIAAFRGQCYSRTNSAQGRWSWLDFGHFSRLKRILCVSRNALENSHIIHSMYVNWKYFPILIEMILTEFHRILLNLLDFFLVKKYQFLPNDRNRQKGPYPTHTRKSHASVRAPNRSQANIEGDRKKTCCYCRHAVYC